MRFQVPQFIEVEDKIFGPLTLKQFIYLAGAGGVLFILLKMLPLVIAIFVAIPVVALALALAFYKINKRPFVLVLESAFKYILSNRLYIWKSKDIKQIIAEKDKADGIINSKVKSEVNIPELSSNRLKDIAWSLDIKESIYSDASQQN
ncbi:PrgI family protein [bacterium]|mgnify:FL=1|nr:PrgI family protein [bacterium]MBT4894973.1 PrgI family protein [bacterium]